MSLKFLVRKCLTCVHAGLLIKQILVSAAETSSERNLVDNTRGIVFYSVPHEGSSLADYSSRTTAAYLLYPSVEVRDLRAGLRAISQRVIASVQLDGFQV